MAQPRMVFHIGPQKAATTWFYRTFREHPEVCVPPRDTVGYYSMHHALGHAWFASHFAVGEQHRVALDPTPSYIRSPYAPARIQADYPDAKIVATLRDPVERAYSHFWHNYKKGELAFTFDRVLKTYDLFQNWIEPGIPVAPLRDYIQRFGRSNLHIIRYETLTRDPLTVYRDACAFMGVAPEAGPSGVDRVVNPAKPPVTNPVNVALRALRTYKLAPHLYSRVTGLDTYERGVSPELREAILVRIRPMIAELEEVLALDLSAWKR